MAGYYFSLPLITQLTVPQQSALNETRPIALSGGPGTGKSVVSLWRHISNYQRNKKSLLLTYTTTLTKYLSACCADQNADAAEHVKTSLKGKPKTGVDWCEIIVDEAQDLPVDYYKDIKGIAKVSYGADDSQILYPDNCSRQEELKALFDENADYVLDKNFRSTRRIMELAKVLFPNAFIPQSIIAGLAHNVGTLPGLLISGGNENKQNEAVTGIIHSLRSDTHNIAILVPWKRYVQDFERVLRDGGVTDFSVYYGEKEGRFPDGCGDIKNVHVTTFKSAKGLEFDTVIIPNFHKYHEICVEYPETCGSYNIEWQDYYVAITRARSNLYLISEEDLPSLNSVTEKTNL